MSKEDGCKHYFYPGLGEMAKETMHYAQAIRIGDRIYSSGQGGWDRETTEVSDKIEEEVAKAFENVDFNLKYAGGKGWGQVYKVTTYCTDMPLCFDHMVANLKKYMPDHHPTWTALGIKELGLPKMHIEIEVEAYDPEGSKAEGSKI